MVQNKIKVLIVTYFPWNDNISTGNTISNIFDGLNDVFEFANIYIKDGVPNNSLCEKYFCISEKQIIKSMFKMKKDLDYNHIEKYKFEPISSKNYDKARSLRWNVFLLAQDMIGIIGKWKSKELHEFINEFSPNMIFGPLGRVPLTNKIMIELQTLLDIPLITYPWDDHYSLKKKSYSPLFWIKTLLERRYIKTCALQSELLYTITDQMGNEYNKYFGKKCKTLSKGYNFDVRSYKEYVNKPIRIIYMGNIGSGRYEELIKVINALRKVNLGGTKIELIIYTSTPLSSYSKNKLMIEGTCSLKNAVPNEQVLEIMKTADILLYLVPTKKKEMLLERLSFSTKIVDYFYSARCILAIGGDTASMQYLKDNDAAIIVDHDLDNVLETILNKSDIIIDYGNKAWNCGVKNHKHEIIKNMLYKDFVNILKAYNIERIT